MIMKWRLSDILEIAFNLLIIALLLGPFAYLIHVQESRIFDFLRESRTLYDKAPLVIILIYVLVIGLIGVTGNRMFSRHTKRRESSFGSFDS